MLELSEQEVKQAQTEWDYYQSDPIGFQVNILDVKPENLWNKMREVAESVRDNPFTCIKAGHGVSKTYEVARLALWFLYCFPPATVITTAPSYNQVADQLWREIRQAHANSKYESGLGGNITKTRLDLQEQTGLRWFMVGFATKADTVTSEATKFQGYHNENIMIIFDEAAGILPEIWRAAQHLLTSGNFRLVVIGNPTSKAGDFADCFSDPKFKKTTISVKDTPNFKSGKELIPGVSGREYEQRIRLKYGVDHDQYKVRVLGEFPSMVAEGVYYGKLINHLKENGRITNIPHHGGLPVYTVWDPGYTTAVWFFQKRGLDIAFIRCYEDSGLGIEHWAEILKRLHKDEGYRYGGHFAPIDTEKNNAYRAIAGKNLLETAQENGINFEVLQPEFRVADGIERTRQFLYRSWFDADKCKVGIRALEHYCEKRNERMSTEDHSVFAGYPEKNWAVHLADAMRYASFAVHRLPTGDEEKEKEEIAKLQIKYRRPT